MLSVLSLALLYTFRGHDLLSIKERYKGCDGHPQVAGATLAYRLIIALVGVPNLSAVYKDASVIVFRQVPLIRRGYAR